MGVNFWLSLPPKILMSLRFLELGVRWSGLVVPDFAQVVRVSAAICFWWSCCLLHCDRLILLQHTTMKCSRFGCCCWFSPSSQWFQESFLDAAAKALDFPLSLSASIFWSVARSVSAFRHVWSSPIISVFMLEKFIWISLRLVLTQVVYWSALVTSFRLFSRDFLVGWDVRSSPWWSMS